MTEKERFEQEVHTEFERMVRTRGVLEPRRIAWLPRFLGGATTASRVNQALVDMMYRAMKRGDRTGIEVLWWIRNMSELTSARNAAAHAARVTESIQEVTPEPPRLAQMMLHLILTKHERDDIIGDLDEECLTVISPRFGPGFARLWYWTQTLRSIVPMLWVRLVRLAKTIFLLELLERIARLR